LSHPDPLQIARACLARAEQKARRTRAAEDCDAVVEIRREYLELKLTDYITRTVDSAPPLTAEQRDRLASLLRPTPAGGSGAA
jgi:hypothetical protein